MKFTHVEYSQAVAEKLWSKHGVEVEEVRQLLDGETHVRRTREGLYQVMGQTQGGRYLMVVVCDLGGGRGLLVTARDMTDKERRAHRKR